ncbi:GntR family transcriptional regulator [Salmonella enterica subsp. diarizonae]|nr:GntR family transcriptional regulator [Salmonella enterica subsp. diarizonae]
MKNKSLVDVLRREILKLIQKLNLNPDDRLPTEHELSNLFNASRASVREALANLHQDGIVYKIQGKGTFVRSKFTSLTNGIDTLFSITEAIKNCGFTPNVSNITLKKIEATEEIANKLKVPISTPCYIMSRVRKADEKIAVYNIDVFLASIFGDNFGKEHLKGSLFSYLDSVGQITSFAHSTISPAILTQQDIPELESQVELFLLFDEIYFNTKGEIIGYTHDFYNSSIFHFNILRKRINL